MRFSFVAAILRIIASTNQDLKAKIRRHEFREDVFYRLNVLPIHLPPLRERTEDISLLASSLVGKHCAELDKPVKAISPELMALFQQRRWEGNIREMENMIIRGILFSRHDSLLPADVGVGDQPAAHRAAFDNLDGVPYKQAKEKTLNQFNHAYIGNLLATHQGNVTQAARAAGLERQALQQIMRRYGIDAGRYRE